MMLKGYPNVIRRGADPAPALEAAIVHPEDFLAYNRAIASLTPLRSLREIGCDIVARGEHVSRKSACLSGLGRQDRAIGRDSETDEVHVSVGR